MPEPGGRNARITPNTRWRRPEPNSLPVTAGYVPAAQREVGLQGFLALSVTASLPRRGQPSPSRPAFSPSWPAFPVTARLLRHGRACPGHPRTGGCTACVADATGREVSDRDTPGHDHFEQILLSRPPIRPFLGALAVASDRDRIRRAPRIGARPHHPGRG